MVVGKNTEGSRVASRTWSQELKAPGKMFTKKFGGTSRLVLSSKVWLHTIPTRECDVLMTFPSHTDDETLMWLLSRLRSRTPELSVHVRHHSHTSVYGFYLTATYENLLRVAEHLCIRKPVKEKYGGGKRDFIFEDQDYFQGIEDPSVFLTTQERQSIVQHMLYNLRAEDGDILGKYTFIEGQALVPYLLSKGVIEKVLPLHNNDDLTHLQQTWVQAIFRPQPLDAIADYFGVKIAMYFAFLGHYTKALLFPTIMGLMVWLWPGKSQATEDLFFVVFAFINVVWSTLYLEHWKRRSAEFAFKWGTLDKEDELLAEPSPLFTGNLVRSPVTGRLEFHYPAWRRNLFFYFVSVPVIALCLVIVFITMWVIFQLQDYINDLIEAGDLYKIFKYFPKVLLALSIGILDEIYKKIAYWLNAKENYRLQESHETHLIVKLVLFQFVNSFLSLFYIAFYLQDMPRLREQLAALLITRQVVGNVKEALVPYMLQKAKLLHIGYQMTEAMSPDTVDRHVKEMANVEKLANKDAQLKATPAMQQQDSAKVIDHKDETESESYAVPSADTTRENTPAEETGEVLKENNTGDEKQCAENKGDKSDIDVAYSGPTLTQAEVEAAMKTYEDTYEDYLEMFIQFGYVTLFSSAFPLAALCAFLNNIIEIRSDAFKLCKTFQRFFGQRVENIGIWQDMFELMSVIAVIVNCVLIGMSGLADRMAPENTTLAWKILLIVLLEHLILIFKFLLAYAIPDVPGWVAEEKARLEFKRRDALKKLEAVGTPKPENQGTRQPSADRNPMSLNLTNSTSAPVPRQRRVQNHSSTTMGSNGVENSKVVKQVMSPTADDIRNVQVTPPASDGDSTENVKKEL